MLVLGCLAALVVAYAYLTFFSNKGTPPDLVTTDDQTSSVSQGLLVTLSNLHTIRLDATIFTNPVFLSLNDFGVTIPPENVGRPNPFAPFSSAGSAPAKAK